ncbi:hypothetical protein B296_00012768 [Ensete ventricosum]|uniref:Uncharacterized protein n=1 Tax=Ensete ventricosum TaxID=4639 RepID=A0A426Z1D3_ENSVE|nr:hypothetical protein B296_00012768 [Ensete ventricosum]
MRARIDDSTEVLPLRYHGAAKPIVLLSVLLPAGVTLVGIAPVSERHPCKGLPMGRCRSYSRLVMVSYPCRALQYNLNKSITCIAED